MLIKQKILTVLTIVMLSMGLTFSKPVHASDIGQGFAQVTFRDLAVTLMAIKSPNLENRIVDKYAQVFHCHLYLEKYQNDFEWARVRDAIRKKIAKASERIRRHYEFLGVIEIERYDFERQMFPLTERTMMTNVGALVFYDLGSDAIETPCGSVSDIIAKTQGTVALQMEQPSLPTTYVLQTAIPITITNIEMAPKDAEQLVQAMQRVGGKFNRTLYLRFRMRLETFGGIRMSSSKAIGQMTGEISAVDMFLDKEKKYYITTINNW